MEALPYKTREELEAGFARVLQSPRDGGVLQMIVRRPRHEERETLQQAELSITEGLVGDVWSQGHAVLPETQLTLTNARLIDLLSGGESQFWPLAGDQLYVDMDLSEENLPPGTRLSVGSAILEISKKPHTGCKKFMSRFGLQALEFISAPERKPFHLRGLNARVIQPGNIRVGDMMRKLSS